MTAGGAAELGVLRRMLAATFLFGSLGTGAELVLLDHTADVWQRIPLALIAFGTTSLAVVALKPAAAAIHAFRVVMALFVAAGLAGILLHYRGNAEFELEMQPGAAGLDLFWESMKGATPALAPGTMVLLGAIGLAYAYGHPAVRRQSDTSPVSGGAR